MDRREALQLIGASGAFVGGHEAGKSEGQLKADENRHRLKIVRFCERLLIDLFNNWRNPPEFIALPITEEIPKDARVVSVRHDWSSRCMEVMIQHDSFPLVPEGGIPPLLPGMFSEFRYVKFRDVVGMAEGEEWGKTTGSPEQ